MYPSYFPAIKKTTLSGTALALSSLIFLAGGAAASPSAYVANEATSSVSVIDVRSHTISATIGLGSDPAIAGTPQPDGPFNAQADHHKPFYNGHLDTHGLWLTEDNKIFLVTNRLSGTVVAIETATQSVLGYAPVGREPHLATVRPGSREAWVAIRGEDYIEVLGLDSLYNETRARSDIFDRLGLIDTMPGPSMVSFTSDGRWAFLASGKEARVEKIDAEAKMVTAWAGLPAAFTPFGLVSPDDSELYLVHKGAGTLSILSTQDLSPVVPPLPIGPRANHITFIDDYAYITIGGPPPSTENPDPQGKIVIIDRRSHEKVAELTGPQFSGEPHGIWPTGTGQLYIGHESGNRVSVIELGDPSNPSDDVFAGTIGGCDADLAFLKKPIDIVVGDAQASR